MLQFFDILVLPILGLIGFCISAYLFERHVRNQPVICPMKAHCNNVISSRYGKLLGVSNTIYGMAYFALIAFTYSTIAVFPHLQTPAILFTLFLCSFGAALFSVYLIAVQAFILRNWCSWCLAIALISIATFFVAYQHVGSMLLPLYAEFRSIFIILHLFAVALGVGGAIISDTFFFRFLKDLRISHDEKEILHTFSQIIWIGIGLFLVSGFGLYAPFAEAYQLSAKFMAKMIVVGIIILNGSVLTFFISPKLEKISFHEEEVDFPGELRLLRKIAFALGAISATSWVAALILGALPAIPFTLLQVVFLYVIALILGITASQILETRFALQAKK